jgi:V/A-type H+/Na+-transporting ATPase subunit F
LKIVAIADSDTVVGLRFAGVKDSYIAETPEEAKEALHKAFQDESVGLIIITEKLSDQLREMITDYTSQHTFPVLVEIPDKHGTEKGRHDPLRDIIRRAVGIELKF